MIYVMSKNNVHPCNPCFAMYKWGLNGCKLHGYWNIKIVMKDRFS